MKKFTLIICFVLLTFSFVNAQITGGGGNNNSSKNENISNDKKNSFSIQGLKFGLGFDYERLVGKYNGIAFSAGILGAEIESKFHFKPQINSSSIGLATGVYFLTGAWTNQLFFEYRSEKHFVFTAGGGISLLDGEVLPAFRLSAGVYFPW
jgi:hypothetical protein